MQRYATPTPHARPVTYLSLHNLAYEAEEACAVGARSAAAEEAEQGDGSAEQDEERRQVVEHGERAASWDGVEQAHVELRLAVDPHPAADAEHRAPAHLQSPLGLPSFITTGCRRRATSCRHSCSLCYNVRLLVLLRVVLFLPREAVLAPYMLSTCVRPSVTSRCCIEKTGQIELVLARRLPFTHPTLCYKEILASPKIRVLHFKTLSQTPDLENFVTASRSRC